MALLNHFIYLMISVVFTVYVGQTLFRHGELFLRECFPKGNAADAVNRLFLAGFYLLNFAFVFVVVRYGESATNLEESVGQVAHRIGLVTGVMGIMHFNNLFWCNFLRERRLMRERVGG